MRLTPQIERGSSLMAEYNAFYEVDEDSPQDAITDILLALEADGQDVDSIVRMALNNFDAERNTTNS